MAILSATNSITGMIGVLPNLMFIDTNDTLATVTTAGYLTQEVHSGNFSPSQNSETIGFVNTSDSGPVLLRVVITGTPPNLIYSLVAPVAAGGAIVEGNIQAGSNGVAGAFLSFPAAVNTGHLVLAATANTGNTIVTITNAAMAGVRTFTVPDPGVAAASFILNQNATTQTIATGNLTIAAGNLTAGSSVPHAGTVTSFPAASGGANDKLVIAAVTTGGNFTTTISNGAMGQSSVITTPDPGAATANFLLDAGAGNLVTDYQQMLMVRDFMLAAGGGAFTLTRNAQGNWSQSHGAAADTSVYGFDITEQLRAAAGRGFELVSFDVIYSIATDVLVAHTPTLATTVFANNVAVAVTNVAITGALATATQAQPYVSNITVNAPAFSNPAAGTSVKQVVEVTVQTSATTAYNVYGVNLRFTKSIK